MTVDLREPVLASSGIDDVGSTRASTGELGIDDDGSCAGSATDPSVVLLHRSLEISLEEEI